MKILYGHQIFAAQAWGGVSRYFVELAREMRAFADVSVHAPLHINHNLAAADLTHSFSLRIPPLRGATLASNFVAGCLPPKGRYDIAHPTWYSKPDFANCANALVHTVYDMVSELLPEEMPPGVALRQSAGKKSAAMSADAVLCISENTRRDLLSLWNLDPKKVSVTPLATSLGEVSPTYFEHTSPYLLYVGRRGGYKNFAALLDAFLSSPSLRSNFSLVCWGGERVTDMETEKLRRLPHSGAGSVRFAGGDDHALSGAYRRAAVFVCPSRYEGFGLPVLEAMACGCVVVSARDGSLEEVGGDAAAYAPDNSDEGLRSILEQVLGDTLLLRRLSEAGRLRSQSFTWRRTAELSAQAYASLQ